MKSDIKSLIRECNKQLTEINEIQYAEWSDLWANDRKEYEKLSDRRVELRRVYDELVMADDSDHLDSVRKILTK